MELAPVDFISKGGCTGDRLQIGAMPLELGCLKLQVPEKMKISTV
jgi:hypothetical protein